MVIFPNHSILVEGEVLQMEIAEIDLVLYLQKQLGDISIAAFEDAGPNASYAGRIDRGSLKLIKLNIFLHDSSMLRKLMNYSWATLVTPIALSQKEIAYIFCPGHCALIAALWAIILRRPYGLYVRGIWLSANGNTSWLWKQVFRKSSFIIATGEAFRRKLSEFSKRVETVVPFSNLANMSISEELVKKLPLIRKFLFVGRLSESKGGIDTIKAVAIARREFHLPVELIVAGGGTAEEEARAKKVADEWNVREYVSFLGHVGDIKDIKNCYQMADAFVFPTYFKEGFPRVLYEAMLFALPIVTTEMPGTEGFLVDTKNCLVCKPRDPQNIAQCIARFSRDPEFAIQLGTRAHKNVQDMFRAFRHPSHADQLISLTKQTLLLGGKKEK
ncbi:MAG: glycosyltransferase family 4 protein [Nitrospirales bacterium]|nr:glycosyltransferase family 4 protein [Nitrospirales bacterium]